jgi:hypothetical protein
MDKGRNEDRALSRRTVHERPILEVHSLAVHHRWGVVVDKAYVVSGHDIHHAVGHVINKLAIAGLGSSVREQTLARSKLDNTIDLGDNARHTKRCASLIRDLAFIETGISTQVKCSASGGRS